MYSYSLDGYFISPWTQFESSVTIDSQGVLLPFQENAPSDSVLSLKDCFVYPSFVQAYYRLLGHRLPRSKDGKRLQSHRDWFLYHDRQWDRNPLQMNPSEVFALSYLNQLISGTLHLGDPFLKRSSLAHLNFSPLHTTVGSFSPEPFAENPSEPSNSSASPYFIILALEREDYLLEWLEVLESMKNLKKHCIILHGIPKNLSLLERVFQLETHFIWTPLSDYLLFQDILPLKPYIDAGASISIASGSSIFGSSHILEEVQFIHRMYPRKFGESISERTLFLMITAYPAKALHLSKGVGNILFQEPANLVVAKKKMEKPLDNLLAMSREDIVLIIQDGDPVYIDGELFPFFQSRGLETSSASFYFGKKEKWINLKGIRRTQNLLKDRIKEREISPLFPLDFSPLCR